MPDLLSDGHGLQILALSVGALLLGPLIHRVARRERVTMAALDNFVLVAVAGLVIVEIAPDALASAGGLGFVALLLGLAAPAIAEGPLRLATRGTHGAALIVAILGMAAHAFTDGLALGGAHLGGVRGHGLEIAVIAHQLPVAVAIWWLLSPVAGTLRAALVLLLIAAATVFGYALAATSLPFVDAAWVGLFQALIGGLLLHVVAHRIDEGADAKHPRVRIAAGVGGLAGIGLLAVLLADSSGHSHAHGAEAAIEPSARMFAVFLELARESAPALLLAFVLAGLVTALLPSAGVRWLGRGGSLSQASRGLLFGLPLPLCSCAVVPVYRGLVARGVPTAAAMAFLVATPELGLDAVLLSLPLLGGPMTIARVAGATVVALAVGWFVGGRAAVVGDASTSAGGSKEEEGEGSCASRCGDACGEAQLGGDAAGEPRLPLGRRLRDGLRTGLVTMVDDVGPWIVFGLVLAALVDPWIQTSAFTELAPALQVAIFAVLGIPTYVCASGATPLVAVLLAGGLSPGAALAFLLTGPATNATTFGLLAQLHTRRVATLFAATIIVMATALGLGLNLVFGDAPLVTHVSHEHGDGHLLENLALAALAALLLASFLRQSPRGFLGKLWELAGWSRHDHSHGGHGHGHGHAGHDHGGRGHGHDHSAHAHGDHGGHAHRHEHAHDGREHSAHAHGGRGGHAHRHDHAGHGHDHSAHAPGDLGGLAHQHEHAHGDLRGHGHEHGHAGHGHDHSAHAHGDHEGHAHDGHDPARGGDGRGGH
ncbi:MAG: permease [Nannocystaceae bacterium]